MSEVVLTHPTLHKSMRLNSLSGTARLRPCIQEIRDGNPIQDQARLAAYFARPMAGARAICRAAVPRDGGPRDVECLGRLRRWEERAGGPPGGAADGGQLAWARV